MFKIMGALALGILSGCTFATGNVNTGKFTILDIHPGGEAVFIDARITGKGSLKVNRNTVSSSEIVTDVIDAVITPF